MKDSVIEIPRTLSYHDLFLYAYTGDALICTWRVSGTRLDDSREMAGETGLIRVRDIALPALLGAPVVHA